jgi:hypothetical protein
MTVQLPETTKVLGTRSVWVVPTATIPDLSTITVANLTAGFKATCYIYGNGGTVTGEQQRGDAPRKLCEVKTRQNLATITESISDLQYSYSPQGDDADEANEMKEAMTFGTTVVIVDRLGISDETAATIGDVVNAHRVTLGYQNRTTTGDDDQAEYSITQGASLDASVYDVVLT